MSEKRAVVLQFVDRAAPTLMEEKDRRIAQTQDSAVRSVPHLALDGPVGTGAPQSTARLRACIRMLVCCRPSAECRSGTHHPET
jgi:hypothetical protein